jgi:hypothetical protein
MYLILGRNFLTGQGYQLFSGSNITFPGVVPVIGGAVWLITGGTRWALSGPSAVFGGLAVIPVYLLARRVFSRRVGIAAAIIFAGYLPLLIFSPFCWYKLRLYSGSEQIFVFIVAWALYFFWRAWQDKSIVCAAAAGLICGVGFQARQESLVLAGIMWWWLGIGGVIAEKRISGNLILRLLAVMLLFAVGSAPFFLFARSVTGHFLLGPHVSHNIVVRKAFMKVYLGNNWRDFLRLYLELNPDATQFQTSYFGVADFHRGEYAGFSNTNIFSKLIHGVDLPSLRYWVKDMLVVLPLYAAPFVLLGVFVRGAARRIIATGFFAAALVPAAMIATMLLLLPRYDVYTSVALVILAAAGLVRAGEFVAAKIKVSPGAVCITAAVLMAAFGGARGVWFNAAARANPGAAPTFTPAIRPMADVRERHIERIIPTISGKLAEIAPPDSRIITHDPGFALLAGDVWIPLPMATFDRVVEFARNQNVSHIVLKSNDLSLNEFTFDEALLRTDLVEIVYRETLDGEDVAILRVLPAKESAPE